MELPSITLLVGLGNPGPRYAATRHNVGFWLVDELVDRLAVAFRQEMKFRGWIARGTLADVPCWLLKPATFMNHSGQSVGAFLRFYQIPIERTLVVHDDLDLAPGTVRLKQGGGHGGHNGLRDIMSCTGARDFWRLRIGIGHPGDRSEVVSYVLSPPRNDERELIEAGLARAITVLPEIIGGRVQTAMQQLHTRC